MVEVNIDQIKPSPYQLRLILKTEDLKEEIKKDGLLSALIVRKKDGYYELVDGQRRLETLKELRWRKVPVEIQEADDRKARLMVYKLNSIRESYSVEEKARYFEKLHREEKMTPYAIGQEFHINDSTIRAYLNIFKFPQDLQRAIFDGRPSIGQIQDMETFINEDMEFAIKFARQIITQDLKEPESRKLLRPYREERERFRLEEAKKTIGTYVPTEAKLETPDDLEKAAQTLRMEARKRREEILTPKEKARIQAEKKRKEEERRERAREKQSREEGETRRRLQEERKRIEAETRQKVERELLTDERFLRKAAELAPPSRLELEEEAPIKLEGMKPADLQEVRERWERLQEEIKETLARPDVKERGELFMNWLAHGALVKSLGSARCPICLKESIACDWKKLVWKCHDLNLEEAYRISSEEYQKSMRRSKG